MIGKIARFGSNFLGALQYVYFGTKANRTRDLTTLRGELVFAQNISLTVQPDNRLKGPATQRLTIERIAEAMQSTASLNNRLRKPVWHQSLAFPLGEQPTRMTLAAICEAFVGTFGLADNQVLAFRHHDKSHDHIHIIANRVDRHGRNTAIDSQNYKRTARFCRLMEFKHGLTPTPHIVSEQLGGKRQTTNKLVITKSDPPSERTHIELDQLRTALNEARKQATDMPTFVEQLRQRGYDAVTSERTGLDGKRRVGIAYGKTFAGGAERWISGSAAGPTFTHRALLANFEQKQTYVAQQRVEASPTKSSQKAVTQKQQSGVTEVRVKKSLQ